MILANEPGTEQASSPDESRAEWTMILAIEPDRDNQNSLMDRMGKMALSSKPTL